MKKKSNARAVARIEPTPEGSEPAAGSLTPRSMSKSMAKAKSRAITRYEPMSGAILLTAAGKELAAQVSGCNSPELSERFLREMTTMLDPARPVQNKMQRMREACAFLASPADAVDAAAAALGRQLFVLETMMMRAWTAAEHVPDPALKASHVNRAAKLHRSYIAAFEALERYLGKGRPQTVRVEHVHISAGAQAVVGIVGGGGEGKHEK